MREREKERMPLRMHWFDPFLAVALDSLKQNILNANVEISVILFSLYKKGGA